MRAAVPLLALLLAGCASEPTPAPSPAPERTAEPNKVVLAPDGLGIVSFGTPAEEVVAALSAEMGEPSSDTGWGAALSTFGDCPGSELRVVGWHSLFVYLGDGDTGYGFEGVRHFFSFSDSRYDDQGQPTEPSGLQTAEGIGVGSTVADLRSAYGEDVHIADSPTFGATWTIRVDDPAALGGNLSDVTDDGTVSSVMGGYRCRA